MKVMDLKNGGRFIVKVAAVIWRLHHTRDYHFVFCVLIIALPRVEYSLNLQVGDVLKLAVTDDYSEFYVGI